MVNVTSFISEALFIHIGRLGVFVFTLVARGCTQRGTGQVEAAEWPEYRYRQARRVFELPFECKVVLRPRSFTTELETLNAPHPPLSRIEYLLHCTVIVY